MTIVDFFRDRAEWSALWAFWREMAILDYEDVRSVGRCYRRGKSLDRFAYLVYTFCECTISGGMIGMSITSRATASSRRRPSISSIIPYAVFHGTWGMKNISFRERTTPECTFRQFIFSARRVSCL